MIIQRNTNAPLEATGVAPSPTMRLSGGLQQLQQQQFTNDTRMVAGIINFSGATVAGLNAGFSGNTTEDYGVLAGQGVDAVDKSGFQVGKFFKETYEMLGGDRDNRDISQQKLFNNYINTYKTGLRIGSEFAKQQANSSIIKAKQMADESFISDMNAGKYDGSVERAWQAHVEQMHKELSGENTTPVVKEKIMEYLNNPTSQALFEKEYSLRMVNNVGRRNAQEGRTQINQVLEASSNASDAKKGWKAVEAKIEDLKDAVNITPIQKEEYKVKYYSTRLQNTMNDSEITVNEVRKRKDELTSKDSPFNDYDKNIAKTKLKHKELQIQYETYNERRKDVVDAMLHENVTVDAVKKMIESDIAVGNLTPVEARSLNYMFMPKEEVAKKEQARKEKESYGFWENVVSRFNRGKSKFTRQQIMDGLDKEKLLDDTHKLKLENKLPKIKEEKIAKEKTPIEMANDLVSSIYISPDLDEEGKLQAYNEVNELIKAGAFDDLTPTEQKKLMKSVEVDSKKIKRNLQSNPQYSRVALKLFKNDYMLAMAGKDSEGNTLTQIQREEKYHELLDDFNNTAFDDIEKKQANGMIKNLHAHIHREETKNNKLLEGFQTTVRKLIQNIAREDNDIKDIDKFQGNDSLTTVLNNDLYIENEIAYYQAHAEMVKHRTSIDYKAEEELIVKFWGKKAPIYSKLVRNSVEASKRKSEIEKNSSNRIVKYNMRTGGTSLQGQNAKLIRQRARDAKAEEIRKRIEANKPKTGLFKGGPSRMNGYQYIYNHNQRTKDNTPIADALHNFLNY